MLCHHQVSNLSHDKYYFFQTFALNSFPSNDAFCRNKLRVKIFLILKLKKLSKCGLWYGDPEKTCLTGKHLQANSLSVTNELFSVLSILKLILLYRCFLGLYFCKIFRLNEDSDPNEVRHLLRLIQVITWPGHVWLNKRYPLYGTYLLLYQRQVKKVLLASEVNAQKYTTRIRTMSGSMTWVLCLNSLKEGGVE